MDRRQFLARAAAALGIGALVAGCESGSIASGDQIMTVTGPIAPSELGSTLPHEHILVDFAGADRVSRDRYDRSAVFETMLPHLEEVAARGCETLVECTPNYLGRDVELFRRLSETSGLQILTNTGYYGANDDNHIPEHAYSDSVDRLAGRWIEEWEDGIDGTDIRPGFIKIGVDSGTLSPIDEKLVRAACRTHRATGLTIASHTGLAVPAFEQLAVLEDEGIDPAAWIWVHAQNEDDRSRHVDAARKGAWVEFDGFSPENTESYVEIVGHMKTHDVLDRTLISQDNGWYHVGEEGGGTVRPYFQMYDQFLPALAKAGFSDGEIRQLTVDNPRKALVVRKRITD
jgi:phosphotriesterase-related protein